MLPVALQHEPDDEIGTMFGLFFVMVAQIVALLFVFAVRRSRWEWTTDSMAFILFGAASTTDHLPLGLQPEEDRVLPQLCHHLQFRGPGDSAELGQHRGPDVRVE